MTNAEFKFNQSGPSRALRALYRALSDDRRSRRKMSAIIFDGVKLTIASVTLLATELRAGALGAMRQARIAVYKRLRYRIRAGAKCIL